MRVRLGRVEEHPEDGVQIRAVFVDGRHAGLLALFADGQFCAVGEVGRWIRPLLSISGDPAPSTWRQAAALARDALAIPDRRLLALRLESWTGVGR